MTAKENPALSQSVLRERAETVTMSSPRPRTNLNLVQAMHELEVHQVELEMQADELFRTQTNLEKTSQRYWDLFELAPVGYLSTDFECRIVEANRATEAIFGVPRSDLVGAKLASFFLPECAAVLHLHRKAVRENLDAQRADVRIPRRDGQVADVQIQSVRAEAPGLHSRSALVDVTHLKNLERRLAERTRHLSDANQALLHEMAARDAAQSELAERERRRRNVEAALERQRGFAERLIEAVPAIVLSLDADGRVLGFNARMAEISEYSLAEVIGESWLEQLIAPEARRDVEEAFSRALKGARASRLPLIAPMTTKSGQLRQIEWYFATMEDHEGKTSGLVSIGQDVSERMQADERLRQAHKMEAVGTLASGIAHDFNNVLTGIIGCADVALTRLPPTSPARAPLDQVKSSALGGAQVIHRLMSFARKQPTERRVVDLNVLVGRMEVVLGHLLGEDMELHISLQAVNGAVSCQADELEQVLMNLCVNARQAAPQGGRLEVSTRELQVAEEGLASVPELEPGNYVVVEVADDGIGMDAQTRERLFDPFFTTKQTGEGTGLGLSSVYATVRAHGGHVSVQSEVGKGATFTVYLPQSEEPPKPTTEAPEADAPLTVRPGNATVLVVEDEPLVRLAMRHYLERHGYEVLEAANDGDVTRILDQHAGSIDVVLTDTVLPGKSGPQIAERVCARHLEAHVIYVSAHSNATLISEGRLPAGTRTVPKPFTEKTLVNRVRECLDDRSKIPRAPTIPTDLALKPRLLLIEDDDDSRAALTELLVDLGCEVWTAADGRAALATRESNGSVDLVVTDISLPDISGVELAHILRKTFPAAGTVLLSGYSVEDVPELKRLLLEPKTAFIGKPVEFAKLRATIERMLGHRQDHPAR